MKAEMARQQAGGEKGERDALTATNSHHLDTTKLCLYLSQVTQAGAC